MIKTWKNSMLETGASGLHNTQDAMQAEIDELRAENGQLRALMDTYNLGGWTDSLALMAKCDALRADAERYRWITKQIVGDTLEILDSTFSVFGDADGCTQEDFDAAIDAARDAS